MVEGGNMVPTLLAGSAVALSPLTGAVMTKIAVREMYRWLQRSAQGTFGNPHSAQYSVGDLRAVDANGYCEPVHRLHCPG